MSSNNTELLDPLHQTRTLDLSVLWQFMKIHKENTEEKENSGNVPATWELLVVQGVLLTLLVLVSFCWALFCKKRCFGLSIEQLRKGSTSSSRDLPPSYSMADLHTLQLGMSVNDYLNPPPEYPGDNLQYLDLEAGSSRLLSRMSISSCDSVPSRLGRISVASCESCFSQSAVVLPVRSNRDSLSSQSSASFASRRDSRTSRNSRVSFSDEAEWSQGSIRRLSSNTLLDMRAHSSSSSRKSSSSSEGSRRSSLVSKVHRKMASTSSNRDSFVNSLDEELQQKLASIGETEVAEQLETEIAGSVRVCDSIEEEK